MRKLRRRCRTDVYADILNAIDRGACKTHIVYRANLNFGRCKQRMTELRRAGLIEVRTHSPPSWAITDRGREFLKKCEEIRKLL